MEMNISCEICHKVCKGQITGGHLKTHGINTKEYEAIYGSAKHPSFLENQRIIGKKGSGGNIHAVLAAKEKSRVCETAYYTNPSRCGYCSHEIPYSKRRNAYCSQSCAAKVNNSTREKQGLCLNCGTAIAKFRSFCGKKCEVNSKKNNLIDSWLSGSFRGGSDVKLATAIRLYLIEQANHACTLCGWDKINPKTGNCPLHIDHVNGDCTDHRPKNLRVICPNCHSLTETYGALNRDNKGRTVRRKERIANGLSHDQSR
jgi:hypothetical protein